MDSITQQNLPIIMDLEASGFGAESYPIEVGVALANGETACYLIRPDLQWQHWDPAGEGLHGLTREQLLKFGRPVQEVARSLNKLLENQTVFSDAWGYDQSWLSLLFDVADLPQRFRLESLQSLFDEAQFDIWNQALEQVYSEFAYPRHRASNDARVIQLAYSRSACQSWTGFPELGFGENK